MPDLIGREGRPPKTSPAIARSFVAKMDGIYICYQVPPRGKGVEMKKRIWVSVVKSYAMLGLVSL